MPNETKPASPSIASVDDGAERRFKVKNWDPSHFPALYQSANHASINAQQWYLWWVKVNLGLLVAGAVAGSISPADAHIKRICLSLAAICFFAALATSILLATRRWERVWYAGRAVAESVKSLTWKFMMGADPFSITKPPGEIVQDFTATLQEVLRENSHLASALSSAEYSGDQVTPDMTNVRGAAVGVLRDVYLAQRVEEQRAWYSSRSAQNRKYRNIWFTLLVAVQGLAGTAAVILAVYPNLPWRATTVFSTLASATIAWGQLKRFQELAQAYGLAAQELSFIAARAPNVGTREDLARFVNDAETAISREHSTWVARRETR
jgi:hypothetical protein